MDKQGVKDMNVKCNLCGNVYGDGRSHCACGNYIYEKFDEEQKPIIVKDKQKKKVVFKEESNGNT